MQCHLHCAEDADALRSQLPDYGLVACRGLELAAALNRLRTPRTDPQGPAEH
jgi:hypothetical protein